MFRLRTFFWLLGVALLVGTAAGAGWLMNHDQGGGGGTTPQETATPTAGSIIALGLVDVETGVVALYPLQNGRVDWLAEEGKQVHKGDVLLRLDGKLARQDVLRAEADLKGAQLQLTKAEKLLPKKHEAAVKQAEAMLDAAKQKKAAADAQLAAKTKLYNENFGSVHDLNAHKALAKEAEILIRGAQAKLDEVEAYEPQLDIDRAQAEVADKEAQLAKAKLGLDECNVRAPEDGVVLRVLTAVGETLGPNPRQPAIQFCPNRKRIIRAEVLQEFGAKVRPGQEAIIEDDTTSPAQWRGKVKRVSDWYTQRRSMLLEPFQFNDVRTLECLITLDPDQPPLRLNQRVRVTIGKGR
jgi:HlyD family secretion protein